jgi:hypothetical protein
MESFSRVFDFGARRRVEYESPGVERDVPLFLIELEIENGKIVLGDAEPPDSGVGRDEEFDFLIGESLVGGLDCDPSIRPLPVQFEAAEFLIEVELAEQEGQGSVHVFGVADGRDLDAAGSGGVEVEVLAVGEKHFARGRSVIPTHTAGLTEFEDAGFRLARALTGLIAFGEFQTQRFGGVVALFDAVEDEIEFGVVNGLGRAGRGRGGEGYGKRANDGDIQQ